MGHDRGQAVARVRVGSPRQGRAHQDGKRDKRADAKAQAQKQVGEMKWHGVDPTKSV
jgi:hypothetical protein